MNDIKVKRNSELQDIEEKKSDTWCTEESCMIIVARNNNIYKEENILEENKNKKEAEGLGKKKSIKNYKITTWKRKG